VRPSRRRRRRLAQHVVDHFSPRGGADRLLLRRPVQVSKAIQLVASLL
jgi:hypothetical protein